MKRMIAFCSVLLCLLNVTAGGDNNLKKKESIAILHTLNNIITYIEGRSLNDHLIYIDNENTVLTYEECCDHFEIELTRFGNDNLLPLYSVLRTNDGGYVYLFWVKALRKEDMDILLSFYFYADAATTPNIDNKPATLKDIVFMDRYTEYIPYMSRGIFSFSYYDKNTLWMVEYDSNQMDHDPLTYTVKNISLVNRKETPTSFSKLLDQDLP